MSTLTKDQLDLIDEVNNPNTITFTTVTRLYIVQENEWIYTGLCGAMAVVKDTQYDSYFLRLIDLDLKSVVWEQEFYENFQYFMASAWLHTVECDECMAGLSFASVPEGKAFFAAVLQGKNGGEDKKKVKKGHGKEFKKSFSSAISFTKKAGKKAGKRIGSVFEKEEKEEMIISGPRNFRHSSHIGWEPDAGFEIRDIPEAWKKIFKASGIKKSELKDKETAAYIMEVISNTMGVAVEDIGDAPPSELIGGQTGDTQIATNVPPPPPPPPSPGIGPPPPGPPRVNAPPPPGNNTPPPPSPSPQGQTSVFDQIKMGASLKKVEENERPNSQPHSTGGTLADTLALAMANRRGAVDSDSDSDDGDGWSSED